MTIEKKTCFFFEGKMYPSQEHAEEQARISELSAYLERHLDFGYEGPSSEAVAKLIIDSKEYICTIFNKEYEIVDERP